MSPRGPQQILEGRYRLIEKVGQGGMGEVWRGEHEITGRALALKFFLGAMGTKQRDRMFREARATSRVNHPNVVEVLDAFPADDGGPVIVMELLVGQTLEERLETEGPLDLKDAARTVLQVIHALAAAHALGIAHRDIKPSNIFLADGPGERPRVKVVDFGVAKVMDDGVTTTAGTVIGTPAYMAPEQIRADPQVDHRADIWSVGIVLHEALSGARPIDGTSVGALVENLVTKGVPSLAETAPGAPVALVEATSRMLVRDLDRRAHDFEEIASALAAILDRPAPDLPAPGSARGTPEPAPKSNPARVALAMAPTASTPSADAETVASDEQAMQAHSARRRPPDLGTLDPATSQTRSEAGSRVPLTWVAAAVVGVTVVVSAVVMNLRSEPAAEPASATGASAPPPVVSASTAVESPAPSPTPTSTATTPSEPSPPPAAAPAAPIRRPPRPAAPAPEPSSPVEPEPPPPPAPPPAAPEPGPGGLVKDVPF